MAPLHPPAAEGSPPAFERYNPSVSNHRTSEPSLSPSQPEAWLRGPLPDVAPHLMPVAHALIQAAEDLQAAAAGLSAVELWERPGGAASAGFHLIHVAGSIDRLLTYARGEALTAEQRTAAAAEVRAAEPGREAGALVAEARAAIDKALAQIRSTPPEALLEARTVGRARLPSTVLGLLFHVGEHTQRHVGQLIATAKVVRGRGGRP
jgi:hypothetical protein